MLVGAALPDALGLSSFSSAVAVALPLLLFGRAFVRDVREYVRCKRAARAAAAEGAAAEAAVLAPGETVVAGKVELAAGEEVASRVEIDQGGTESENSGTWYFTWSEKDRRVTMRPFYIRHASGQRVRVEPSSRALLVDELDRMVLVNDTTRTRIAELTAGERVFASGLLAHGPDPESDPTAYRSSTGKGWVLTPPSNEEMLLSSENLDARFHHRARRLLYSVAALGAVLIGLLGISSAYFERLLFGRDTEAVVLAESQVEKTDSDGDSYTEYSVQVRVGDNVLWVGSNLTWNTRVDQGTTVPLRFVASNPSRSALGHGAHVELWSFAAAVPVMIVTLGLLAVARSRKGRWFEGKLEETGKGRLAENRSSVRSS